METAQASSVIALTGFPKFRNLPAELRLQILGEAVEASPEMNEPGVCICACDIPNNDIHEHCVALIKVPAVLKACQEAENVIEFKKLRNRHGRVVSTPIRQFRPELDTLLLHHDHARYPETFSKHFSDAERLNIRWIALDICHVGGQDCKVKARLGYGWKLNFPALDTVGAIRGADLELDPELGACPVAHIWPANTECSIRSEESPIISGRLKRVDDDHPYGKLRQHAEVASKLFWAHCGGLMSEHEYFWFRRASRNISFVPIQFIRH